MSDSSFEPERPAGPPPGQGFFDWLRGLGITRGSDRWFAGVAGGIAEKAGIDPIIVRGVFVVLAVLGGPGILLYALGWLLLPDRSGRIHVEDIFRGRAETGVLIAAIVFAAVVVIPAALSIVIPSAAFVPMLGFWHWDLWSAIGVPGWLTATAAWLFWIAIIVLGFVWMRRYLLRRGRAAGEQGPGSASGPTPASGPAAFVDAPQAGSPSDGTGTREGSSGAQSGGTFDARAQRLADRAEAWGEQAGRRAEAWSEDVSRRAGAWGEDVGRRADAWSARYAEQHEAHRIGAAQVIITLALALLAGGGAVLWARAAGEVSGTDSVIAPALIAGLVAAVAVLAVSLIVAGIRGRHTGWVGFLAFSGVVALLISAVLPWGIRYQAFGNVHVDGEQPGAALIAGNIDVDLTDLDRHLGESGRSRDLVLQEQPAEVWHGFGNTVVHLPESHPVLVEVRVLAGRIGETGADSGDPGGYAAGPLLARTITANLPAGMTAAAARESDEVATVTVTLLAGGVEVRRSDGRPSGFSSAAAPRGTGSTGSALEFAGAHGIGAGANR